MSHSIGYKRLTVIGIVVIIASCQNSKQKQKQHNSINPSSSYYYPSKIVDSITNVFIDSLNCDDCLCELYIDKVYEDETYFTFKARKYYKDYFSKNKPSFYFQKKGKNIFIYTGAESFIIGDQKYTDTLPVNETAKGEYFLLIAFRLANKSLELVKVANLPFSPQFDQFTPSDSDAKLPPIK